MKNLISRRKFLQSAGAMMTVAGTGLSLRFSPADAATPASGNNSLVILFFRGGMDALNFLVPLSGTNRVEYETKRPNIHIPTSLTLSLNNDFGLPASCPGLQSLYHSGDMAMVHAVGMPLGLSSRSHFDSMTMFERGTPGDVTTSEGWLSRHIRSLPSLPPSTLIHTMSPGNPPESLYGLDSVLAIDNEDTSNFHPNRGLYQEEHLATLEKMYPGDGRLDIAMRSTIVNVNILTNLSLSTPGYYPDGSLAHDLGLIAQIIKADLGLQIATVDFGGWDTHQFSGDRGTGYFVNQLGVVSEALTAFFADLANAGKKDSVVLATQTDFGRRVRENGNRGTDHGTAQVMMVAGGNVNGGQIFGSFPGIRSSDLYLNADLAVTTDFRRPLSDILLNHLGNSQISTVFPGYKGDSNMGLIKNKVIIPDEQIFSSGFE